MYQVQPNIEYRQTHTVDAGKADDVAKMLDATLCKKYEWVTISSNYPIFLNGRLHYTFTVTAGTLI